MALAINKTLELELYNPHETQTRMHESKARFRVASLGRQAGKSTWANNELAFKAWTNPRTRYFFVSPSYDQAKVQFRRFLDMFPVDSGIYRRKPNENELWLPLKSYSDILYKSGAVLHRLRGDTIHGQIIDEMRDQPPELYNQVLRPMLTTTQGWASFVSTPRGFDQFYDVAQKAIENKTGEWEFFHAPSTCNPLFTEEEFKQLKSEMSEAEFAQEILAEFRELNRGGAYTSFSAGGNLREVSPLVSSSLTVPVDVGLTSVVNPYLPIELYCDWNVTYMGWTMSQFRHGTGHYVFDEIYLERSHTQEAADLFIQKYREIDAEINLQADPAVILVGDATGKSQKTSASGQTDFTILETALKKAGITYRNLTPSVNPQVKDRVNTMNARMKAADGTQQLWIHPKRAPKTKRDCERVTWKLNAQGAILDQSTDPSLTHLSDSLGYGVFVRNPINGVNNVGGLRVIRR